MNEKLPVPKVQSSEFEEREINLHEYWLVIVKRRWMILVVLFLTVILGAIYTFRQTPLYQSTAVMYIDRLTYNIVPEIVTEAFSYQAFFQTQYRLLKSKTLAMRVAKRLNLTPADLAPPKERKTIQLPSTPDQLEASQRQVTGQLLGMVSINPIKDTTLCEITFTTPDPKLSMILANTWAEEYVDYSLASQYEYTQKAGQLLVEQVRTLQAEIAEKEKLLQDYSLEKQIVKIGNDRSMIMRTLEDLNAALSTAIQERISKEVYYRDLQNRKRKDIAEASNNSSIQQLKGEYTALERRYIEKSKMYKDDYPEMVRIRSEMNLINQRIEKEINDTYQQVLSGAKATYQEAFNKENALQQQIEQVKRQTVDASRKEYDYDRLKLELDDKKRLLESLRTKRSEADVSAQVKEKKATTIRIVDPAEMPSGIFKPSIRRNVSFSLMLGLIIALGFTFLLDYLDRSLKSPEEVERRLQLPFLGMIPRYDLVEDNDQHGESKSVVKRSSSANLPSQATYLLSLYNPSSIVSEAFKSVRTSLLLSFPEAAPFSILVTSSRPSEGKTFVACNLAISLAQLDKSVVLIDADMRNPHMYRIWDIRRDKGLSTFLTSDIQAADLLVPSGIKGLFLMSSGAKSPRPAELLSSSRIETLFEQLRQKFDHVIIDSPPLIPVADSLILAAKCNSVVMIIRGGETPRDAVQIAMRRLLQTDAVITGAVLNDVDLSEPYYYYHYYSYYSKYGYRDDEDSQKHSAS